MLTRQNWGLIRNNCIVIQAEYDDRLGLEHYHRLIKHREKFLTLFSNII